ncbi:dipicolinate synthase subunit DpsA [Virgibacillus sp. Bac330]|uniref:dipicolinate synthase subunit DpsA n=1 Tax=Virgibacillus sp. Bac330 TaxID=2419841 RepID=UPI000EF4B679|nr:dipicolinate synthase subunit DpsA [Virgibacillus sp. Bac330]
MLHILVVGGDKRYIHVIETLAKLENNLYLIGFDTVSFDKSNVKHAKLEHMDLSIIDAIILPIAGTDERGQVEIMYANGHFYLTEQILSSTPDHCTIYTGTANDYLQEMCKAAQRSLIRLFDRDDVAIYNSIPTAEGALKIAIEETEETIHNANVCVLGFGRVGKTVARLFHAVGANVYVVARNHADLARVTEMGLTPIKPNRLHKLLADMAICINTIPSLTIDDEHLSKMSISTVIIDLASKPGGVDFVAAQKRGIKTVHALGLPGKTAPKSAGRIIANILMESLKSEQKHQ